MRKDYFVGLVGLVLILGIIIIGGYADTHYKSVAKVYNKVDNETIMIDGAGYLWSVIDRDDLKVDDFVEISFFNNGTDYTREDDEITNIKIIDERD